MDTKLLERESLNESVTVSCLLNESVNVSCLLSRFELPMDMKLLERELLLNGSVTVSCLLFVE